MNSQFSALAGAFLNYFDVELVATPDQRKQAERVRYNVYCEEFGYEPTASFPLQREFDDYDDSSLQLLVTHRKSRRAAGCVRLILASEKQRLPLEDHCLESVYVDYLARLNTDRSQASEFSRLAVDAAFRKRPGDSNCSLTSTVLQDCCTLEQQSCSLVGIASFLGAFALANISDRSHLFAMMEPRLPRLLRRSGIYVKQAGATTAYHGQRSPFFITTEDALEHMREDLLGLYNSIHARLLVSYQSYANVA